MVVCKVCGTENDAGAAFCGSCGAFLEWNADPTVPAPGSADEAPTQAVPVAPVPPTPAQSAATPDSTPTEPLQPDGSSVLCPACGTPNDPSRTYCRRCATELAPAAPAPPPAADGPRRSGPPVALLGGLAAVVVVGALAAVVVLPRLAPASTATSAPSGSALAGPAGSPSPISGSPPAGGPGASGTAAPSPSTPTATTPVPSPSAVPALTGEIVFAATRNGNTDVWAWNAADGTQHRLAGGAGDQSEPAWAWDRSAAVYRTADGLRIINANGSVPSTAVFTHHGLDRHPVWSPNGKLIAFATPLGHGKGQTGGDLNIFTRLVADGTTTHRLTDDPADDWGPSWSPDGSTIVFVSKRDGDAHLFLMNADGSRQRLLDLGTGIYDDPTFSPDGQWLAFTRRDRANDPKALYVVHPDGTGMRRLTQVAVGETDPAWSPDGRFIAVARVEPSSPIVVVDATTGAEVASLGVPNARNRTPSWR